VSSVIVMRSPQTAHVPRCGRFLVGTTVASASSSDAVRGFWASLCSEESSFWLLGSSVVSAVFFDAVALQEYRLRYL
jgi:hypothetical protein